MRWTQVLVPTLREAPADERGAAERLLARAGMVRQTPAGPAFLPMGFHTLRRLFKLIRSELHSAGFCEILTGGSDSAEAVAGLAAGTIGSYRQLPVRLFCLSNNASGTPRVLTHSFHSTETDAKRTNDALPGALERVAGRCGLRVIEAESTDGHALVALSDEGEESVFVDDAGEYVATAAAARIADRPWSLAGEPTGPLEQVRTPVLASVGEVGAFLKITPRQILKTLVFQATSPIPVRWVVAVVRGDHQVNLPKLARAAEALGATDLKLADSPEVRQRFAIGFVGPDAGTKTPDAVMVIDPDAARGDVAWFAGANEADHHVRNFNWFREAGDKLADPAKVLVADIRDAVEGDPSPVANGGALRRRAAYILGQIGAPSTRLTEAHRALFDDESGTRRPLILSSGHLDLWAILRAIVDAHHDDHGLCWPAAIAPCPVVLTPIKYDGEVKDAADTLYTQLTLEGIDTILDDRDVRAGVKFADADLVGFPIRINIGLKNLGEGVVEMKRRAATEVERIRLDDVVPRVRAALVDS